MLNSSKLIKYPFCYYLKYCRYRRGRRPVARRQGLCVSHVEIGQFEEDTDKPTAPRLEEHAIRPSNECITCSLSERGTVLQTSLSVRRTNRKQFKLRFMGRYRDDLLILCYSISILAVFENAPQNYPNHSKGIDRQQAEEGNTYAIYKRCIPRRCRDFDRGSLLNLSRMVRTRLNRTSRDQSQASL